MDNGRSSPRSHSAVWFRVLLPTGSLGPGKIMLMRCIAETGSVSGAAQRLEMSHARSVKLVAELNSLAATPLVATRSGGESGGGASITPLGTEILALYDHLEQAVALTSKPGLKALEAALNRG